MLRATVETRISLFEVGLQSYLCIVLESFGRNEWKKRVGAPLRCASGRGSMHRFFSFVWRLFLLVVN